MPWCAHWHVPTVLVGTACPVEQQAVDSEPLVTMVTIEGTAVS